MKKQTFIIRLEDENGIVVDFERWGFKQAKTCIDHMIALYKDHYGLYGPGLEKASRVVCYPTPDGYTMEAPVWIVSADEFRKLLGKEASA